MISDIGKSVLPIKTSMKVSTHRLQQHLAGFPVLRTVLICSLSEQESCSQLASTECWHFQRKPIWPSRIGLAFVMRLQLWQRVHGYFAQGTVEELFGFLFLWLARRRVGCRGRGVGRTVPHRIGRGRAHCRRGGGGGCQGCVEEGQARTLRFHRARSRERELVGGQRWLARIVASLTVVCQQYNTTQHNTEFYRSTNRNNNIKMWK